MANDFVALAKLNDITMNSIIEHRQSLEETKNLINDLREDLRNFGNDLNYKNINNDQSMKLKPSEVYFSDEMKERMSDYIELTGEGAAKGDRKVVSIIGEIYQLSRNIEKSEARLKEMGISLDKDEEEVKKEGNEVIKKGNEVINTLGTLAFKDGI
ncbi:hypothetical protein O3M35_003386 [Rhynocoris fuscipes]|uniref:Uncharacterized protein n=1 Tax=Rhynocoris fuscipes TaxID=488301 RepID=A0AAW1CJV5_9HEMI